jgi:hypothetical protein
MSTIQTELTSGEYKAFESVAFSPEEWVDNLAKERARVAIEEITQKLINHCNDNEIALAVGQDAQIDQAFELGLTVALKDVPPPEAPDLSDPSEDQEPIEQIIEPT